MAGDWIKMCVDLPDKPEVWHMAGILSIDADSVVGKLVRVWAWFDSHTLDGNAVGVSFALVDRVAGITGFAEAMALAGWLEQNGHILSLPKFSRHNGKTAKNRALTNERVAKHRALSNDDSVTASVTKTVTREEKRREEEIHSEAKASGAGAPPSSADVIFALGLPLLTAAGVNEKNCRSMLGLMRKTHGDEQVIDALQRCAAEKPLQPVPWLQAALKSKPPRGDPQVPQWKRDQLARIAEFAGPAAARPNRSEFVDVDSRLLD